VSDNGCDDFECEGGSGGINFSELDIIITGGSLCVHQVGYNTFLTDEWIATYGYVRLWMKVTNISFINGTYSLPRNSSVGCSANRSSVEFLGVVIPSPIWIPATATVEVWGCTEVDGEDCPSGIVAKLGDYSISDGGGNEGFYANFGFSSSLGIDFSARLQVYGLPTSTDPVYGSFTPYIDGTVAWKRYPILCDGGTLAPDAIATGPVVGLAGSSPCAGYGPTFTSNVAYVLSV
jgi:hypothetical protein